MELRAGYKQTEVGVIPEDWDSVPITDYTREIFLGLTSKVDYVSRGGVPLVRATDIASGRLSFANVREISVAQHKKLTKYRKARRGNVLVSKSGSLGVCALVENDREFSIYESIIVLQPGTQLDSKFLLSLLRHERTQTRMVGAKVGSTVSHLNLETFRKLVIPLPPTKAEQEAIAGALSDADGLIESLEQLVAKKRHLKQGAMQQLLTGKKRLPGFSGEWEEKLLGDVVNINKGTLITGETAKHGPVPVIAGGKKPAYFHNSANRTGKTITVSGSGANAGYVGYYDGPIFASDCSTIGEGGNYTIEFVYFLLLMNQEEIYKAQTGGAQPHIHPNDLRPLEFAFPKTTAEQTAIAGALSDMDGEIEALETKLGKARQLKAGMMHNLLTGRIRLI
jgi:type I restriction enzyme, S subunit